VLLTHLQIETALLLSDPRWGRDMESLGEDPYLIGQLATEYTRGLQYGE
jgi:beta-glucosidase-like glycosyl hydrolase